jgi:hypothetical protein
MQTEQPIPKRQGTGRTPRRFALYVIPLVLVALFLTCAIGIAGYFRLSSESRALRSSLMNSVAGQWHKKFAVHVGFLTMAVVRAGSQFFNIPKEPRAALDALRGAEVGVYNLEQGFSLPDYSAVFQTTDKAMTSRGWTRVVGVAKDSQFVAAYIPTKGLSAKKVACCVVVLHDRQLVIASARGNAEPLLLLVARSPEFQSAVSPISNRHTAKFFHRAHIQASNPSSLD